MNETSRMIPTPTTITMMGESPASFAVKGVLVVITDFGSVSDVSESIFVGLGVRGDDVPQLSTNKVTIKMQIAMACFFLFISLLFSNGDIAIYTNNPSGSDYTVSHKYLNSM